MKKILIAFSLFPILSFAMTEAQEKAFNKANINEAIELQRY